MTSRSELKDYSYFYPHNVIFHPLTRFQLDFVLRGLGIASQLCAFERVPGSGTRLPFFRGGFCVQPVAAWRNMFELECAVALNDDFGVSQKIVCGGIFSWN